jgi:hypothetical protein
MGRQRNVEWKQALELAEAISKRVRFDDGEEPDVEEVARIVAAIPEAVIDLFREKDSRSELDFPFFCIVRKQLKKNMRNPKTGERLGPRWVVTMTTKRSFRALFLDALKPPASS